ncbi:MAG: sulfur transferase domain-containing protein, partial [Planctomycetota bacterium]
MLQRPTACLAIALACLTACTQPAPAPAPTSAPTLADSEPRAYPGLDNVVAYAPEVYSGSVPHGAEGFRTLAAWGVDTVISVDGAAPDVAAARAAGLRYVHLPIRYDGMDAERTLEIARAVSVARERGAVYLHCHHGKHRSAGAAGAAAVTLGWSTTAEATAR